MGFPHILAIPYPAQGHVIPMMELCYALVEHGFKVTFVNTEFNHNRVMNVLAENGQMCDMISLVSIPDGLGPSESRNELGSLNTSMLKVMPGKLEELIEEVNRRDGDMIKCIVADQCLGWAMEVAERMGLRRASFCTSAVTFVISGLEIENMIKDGIIDHDGTVLKNQMIRFSQNMPAMNTSHLTWACIGDAKTQNIIFNSLFHNSRALKLAEWVICNSTLDLEPAAFDFASQIKPIGPLLASKDGDTNSMGHFWKEESASLKWLDKQPPNSVIYVAFGSFTVFDQTQFKELALGLELCNKPFLWVVRPDLTAETETRDAYPEGFRGRVSARAQMVGWAPQQKVLSHPAIACFVSHCGWNSTLESVSNGVPILCWPYFGDQFLNESYICDVWKAGLRFDRDENGIITRYEIMNKVQELLGNEMFIKRALDLKEVTMNNVGEGGSSYVNFQKFVEWIKS